MFWRGLLLSALTHKTKGTERNVCLCETEQFKLIHPPSLQVDVPLPPTHTSQEDGQTKAVSSVVYIGLEKDLFHIYIYKYEYMYRYILYIIHRGTKVELLVVHSQHEVYTHKPLIETSAVASPMSLPLLLALCDPVVPVLILFSLFSKCQ